MSTFCAKSFSLVAYMELKWKLKYKREINVQAASPDIIFINISIHTICLNPDSWGCAPFTETEVSFCSFICVRTEAQTCTRKLFDPDAHKHKVRPRCRCTDVLVFWVFRGSPCKESPETLPTKQNPSAATLHRSRRKNLVVAAQPVASEPPSGRAGASDFPDEARTEGTYSKSSFVLLGLPN